MLVATYEINGAKLEVFDDCYCNLSEEELNRAKSYFLTTAQNILKSNWNKDSEEPLSNESSSQR
ncbi:MAG: hypothetical protein ACERKN_11660 [Velocimicrobium sp.]